jgi:hypothetical protein
VPLNRVGEKTWVALFLFGCLMIPGCGAPTVGDVSGNVTVDGEPAKSGSIAFFAVDGMSSTAGGAITDGQYAVRVPPGECRIEIRVSKVVGEKKLYDAPDSPVQPILAEVLPPKYNDDSELTFDVKPGKQKHDFNLQTD